MMEGHVLVCLGRTDSTKDVGWAFLLDSFNSVDLNQIHLQNANFLSSFFS